MTAPENKPADAPVTTTTNAPAFVDHSAAAAAEITRLNGLLAAEQAKTSTLETRVQELEVQVDSTKSQELEQRLAALEAENATLKTERDTLATTQARANLLADLAGKVRDPEAVAVLMTDELRLKDGKPDVEAIIAKYPYLAPEGVQQATAPNGAGGVQTTAATNLDKAVETKDASAINAAMDAELKGANQ